MTGKKKLSQAPVVSIFLGVTPGSDDQAVIGLLDGETRSPVEQMISGPKIRAITNFLHVFVGHSKRLDRGMEIIRMAGIDAAFERLKIIRLLKAFRDVAMTLRHDSPLDFRQFWNPLRRAHKHPHQAAVLSHGIRVDTHLA